MRDRHGAAGDVVADRRLHRGAAVEEAASASAHDERHGEERRDALAEHCGVVVVSDLPGCAVVDRQARAAFHHSYVVQYVNFWPCEWNDDHHYMSRLFAFAAAHRIGLGGPDVVPWRKGQMKNAYPFFHRYKGKLPLVAMAVQEPTLTYRDPATGKPFTWQAFESFAADYLGADIIFWTPQAPWLRR